MELNISSATNFVHFLLSSVIKAGDIVIDATCGNGNDTIFLAKLVGESGKVFAFDIQDNAIKTTSDKLKENSLINRVNLIKDSHVNLSKYVNSMVKAVVFNLGYLPNSDRKIVTEPENTIAAIKNSLHLLQSNGLLTVVCYLTHNGGMQEFNSLSHFFKVLNKENREKVIQVTYTDINAPVIFIIQKKDKIQ